jgi:hypothetical protein
MSESRTIDEITLAEVRDWATELVDLVDRDRKLEGLPGNLLRKASIVGTHAHGFAIYRSILVMVDGGERAGVGVLARVLYEAWLMAVLLCNGTATDWHRLVADLNHYKAKLAKGFDQPVDEPIPTACEPAAWKVFHRAERVDELRGDGEAVRLYRTVYAAESLAGTHASLGAAAQYFDWNPTTGKVEIDHKPVTDGFVRTRLVIASLFFAELAAVVIEAGGQDASDVRAARNRYHDIAASLTSEEPAVGEPE